MNYPLIVVTPGDPDGIGPEICWKSAGQKDVRLLFVGARKPFDEMGAKVIEVSEKELLDGNFKYPFEFPGDSSIASNAPFIWLLAAPTRVPKKGLLLEGYQSGWSIEKAVSLIHAGIAQAITTGPISKERLQKGGYKYPGHTEFLADLCRGAGKGLGRVSGGKSGKGKKKKVVRRVARGVTPEVTMMLANDQLRVSLVTTHIGLKTVSRHLTRAKLRRAVLQTVEHLRSWWGISKPRIAIAALNPHAGEAGLFGSEEIRIITPEIRALQKLLKSSAQIEGPLPADTLFAKNHLASPGDRYDAVICMYHDQGLIPVKLLDFRKTVNVTLGLPIVRTSVDHGVGFDIAKTGKADPSSLQSAITLAREIISKKTNPGVNHGF